MTQLSRTARYYRRNRRARKKKQAYDKEYNKRPEQKAKRVENNRKRRRMIREGKIKKGDPRDISHTKNGSTTLEHKRKNRARQGANGKSTLK